MPHRSEEEEEEEEEEDVRMNMTEIVTLPLLCMIVQVDIFFQVIVEEDLQESFLTICYATH